MTSPDEVVPCRAPLCGRPLKTAESKARGMGPVCWQRHHPAPAARHAFPAGPSTPTRPLPTGPDLFAEQPDDDPVSAR